MNTYSYAAVDSLSLHNFVTPLLDEGFDPDVEEIISDTHYPEEMRAEEEFVL